MDNGPGLRSTILMEWGERGAAAICSGAAYAVIVDVLSFTTSLSVAIDAGAEVYPYRWRDESAPEFARRHNAVLALDRSAAQRPGVITLSPTSRLGSRRDPAGAPITQRPGPGQRACRLWPGRARRLPAEPNGDRPVARRPDPDRPPAAGYRGRRSRRALGGWCCGLPWRPWGAGALISA